jgi:transcriptional regulator with XRE-family HTH domain
VNGPQHAVPGTGSAGGRVRHERRRRGMSLEALADRIGKSKGWLSMIENGRLQLDGFSDLVALAGVLQVPMPALTGIPCPGCPRTPRRWQQWAVTS